MIPNGPEACDDATAVIDDGCLDNCQVPASCFELLQYDNMAPDGMYMIGPPGWMDQPFPAYCDMTNDGGGWTLAMRFAPVNGQFDFYSIHWTGGSLVNQNVQDPTDPSDGKFWAYDFLPGDEIRGCLQNPNDQQYGCKVYDLPMPATTLLDTFANVPVGSDASMQGHYFTDSDAGKLEWLSIQGRSLDEASVVPQYIEVGMNIDDDQSCYDARVRFGLVLNNEVDVWSLNDAAGFGAQSWTIKHPPNTLAPRSARRRSRS